MSTENEWSAWIFLNGRYKGRLVLEVLLKHPGYIEWYLKEPITTHNEARKNYIGHYITTFDELPFTGVQCAGRRADVRCEREVVNFSLYQGKGPPAFWCDQCEPHQLGARDGTLNICERYVEAIHIMSLFRGRANAKRMLIRRLAIAKGLNGRFTTKRILRFFHGAR